MKFYIKVPVSAYYIYEVEAENEEKAIEMVLEGECDVYDQDYVSLDLDTNNWAIEERHTD